MRKFPEEDLSDSLNFYLRFDYLFRNGISNCSDLQKDLLSTISPVRRIISINASYVYFNEMSKDYLDEEKDLFINEKESVEKEFGTLESLIFTRKRKEEGKKPDTASLREASIQMEREV